MDLNDFLEDLCLGELSNLYIGLEGQVDLHPQNRAKLINYVNQGLNALYSRFALQKKELIIRGQEFLSLYHMDQKFSMSIGTSKTKYIDDTRCEPFCNDLIKILEVYNEVGIPFKLNVKDDNESLHTPSWNSLQILHPVQDQGYFVIYQAKPVKIAADTDGCIDLNLPPILIEGLAGFVASKVYSHMNGQQNKATAQEQMAVFEAKCLELVNGDLGSDSETSFNSKAEQRGFI